MSDTHKGKQGIRQGIELYPENPQGQRASQRHSTGCHAPALSLSADLADGRANPAVAVIHSENLLLSLSSATPVYPRKQPVSCFDLIISSFLT